MKAISELFVINFFNILHSDSVYESRAEAEQVFNEIPKEEKRIFDIHTLEEYISDVEYTYY